MLIEMQARQLTEVRLAKTLGITQDGVSHLKKRSDLLLSALRKSVEAMGGNLSLVPVSGLNVAHDTAPPETKG